MSQNDHSESSDTTESTGQAQASASAQAVQPTSRKAGRLLWIVPLVLVLVLGAALFEQNRQYRVLQADFQRQHGENTQLIQNARQQAAQAMNLAQKQADRLQELSGQLDAVGGQLQELDQALQMMTDSGSDLLLLNDIDHLVTIGQQQLSLGGNVANAIISLEAAQAQLARANRPALAALQQSINGDLDRLRTVATINLPVLSSQLDDLSDLVGSAPLLIPDAAAPLTQDAQPASDVAVAVPPPAETADQTADRARWQQVLEDSWQWTRRGAEQLAMDLRGLLDVRRVDDAAALLMSPDQSLNFREGLKQRAVTAQLALMMHQSRIWKSELARIAQAIDQRYDMRSESSRQALKLARDLHDTPIETTLPTVANSLAAIAAARDAQADQDDTGAAGVAGQDMESAEPVPSESQQVPASTGSI